MGCCKSKLEIGELVLTPYDNLDIQYKNEHLELTQKGFTNSKNNRACNLKKHGERHFQTEEGFSEVSLDSHEENNYGQQFETSRTRLLDSMIYYTRPTSISLHRTDIEAAFLQNSGVHRKNTIDSPKHENLTKICEFKN
ncbi:hypothetical protein SteCoe_21890 [Stentor coeruleus]|uniref:Uncharacterized protein n=1 Tax=Stentor coeruleus TaxID=5963 RepID=A0A1R2BNQ3_9CILI|nr:hypothetical protein SteCoe_21890 [Stentor coeruleus]